MENQEDIKLRKQAKSIAGFKKHLVIFLGGNVIIWLLWFIFSYGAAESNFWAVYPTIAWLVVIIFHYFMVYQWSGRAEEKEYKRLVKEKEMRQKEAERLKLQQENKTE